MHGAADRLDRHVLARLRPARLLHRARRPRGGARRRRSAGAPPQGPLPRRARRCPASGQLPWSTTSLWWTKCPWRSPFGVLPGGALREVPCQVSVDPCRTRTTSLPTASLRSIAAWASRISSSSYTRCAGSEKRPAAIASRRCCSTGGREVDGLAAVGGQAHARGEVADRVEVAHRATRSTPCPVKHTVPWTRVASSVSGSVGVPTSSSAASTPPGTSAWTAAAISPVSSSGWSTPSSAQPVEPVAPAGGREHGRPELPRERGRGDADRRRAAADQQRLAGAQVQPGRQRAVRGLQRLGQRADDLPRQLRRDRDHAAGRDDGVLGVAAVERAAHAAHHRHDLLPRRQAGAGRGVDDAGALDPGHAREARALREPEPQVQLRAVQPERLDADPDPARRGLRDRQRADPQGLGRAGSVQHDGAHGRRHDRTKQSRQTSSSPPPAGSRAAARCATSAAGGAPRRRSAAAISRSSPSSIDSPRRSTRPSV